MCRLVFRPYYHRLPRAELSRIITALGGKRLWYAECEFNCTPLEEIHYYQLRVTSCHQADSFPDAVCAPADENCLFAERRKARMSLGHRWEGQVNYGFLTTGAQINQQMTRIIEKLKRDGQYRDPADEVSTDLLVRLFLNICGGFDTPYLERDGELHDE
jgi:hypothetical protein